MSQISSPVSLPQLTYKGVPVVTTETLAHAYEVESKQIRQNFTNNRGRFVEGKHFFQLSGNDLKEFKNYVENFDLVQLDKRARHFTLWTERGAARHAKMLNSDRAWDMFELLEETFFRAVKTDLLESPDQSSSSLISVTPSTVADRKPLRSLVNAWARLSGHPFGACWNQVKAAFRLTDIRDLPQEWISDAIAWVQAKIDALPKALPTATPALSPAPAFRTDFPADMTTGRKDALRKIQSLMAGVGAARDVVRLFCHPGGKSMHMTLDEKEIYDALYQLYCAADDSLLAAYRALDAGYKIGRQYGRG